MIDINLLPEEYKRKKTNFGEVFNKYKNLVLPIAGIAGGLMVLVALIVVILPKFQQRTLNKLERRWNAIGEEYKEAVNLKNEQKKLQDLLGNINKMSTERILWANMLNIISDKLPQEIQLVEISTQAEKIKDRADRSLLLVSGIVPMDPGERAIGEFIKGLRENPDFVKSFPDIKPPSTETSSEGYKKFTLKCYMSVLTKETAAPEKKKKEKKNEIK